jgi:hypothetical protein
MLMPGRTYSNGSHYRYGFNGQEKSTEIDLSGNINTAEFWEYDSRIMRRWNLDPKPTEGISEYSAFNGNPILNRDVLGDQSGPGPSVATQALNAVTGFFDELGYRAKTHWKEDVDFVKSAANTLSSNAKANWAAGNTLVQTIPKDMLDNPLEYIEVGAEVDILKGIGIDLKTTDKTFEVLPQINKTTDANLAERANEIHTALPKATQTRTTTAVATAVNQEGKEVTLVASSEKRLRPAQRAILKPNETAVIGAGHAEETIMNHANANGLKVKKIAASRPICSSCAESIREGGATATSPLKKTTTP